MVNGNDILEFIESNTEGLLEIWCEENKVDIDYLMKDDKWVDEILYGESMCEIACREFSQ